MKAKRHLYRLFTRDNNRKSNLVATYTVALKTTEEISRENKPGEAEWFRVNRKWQLVH